MSNEISIVDLARVTGGINWKGAAAAGMHLVAGEEMKPPPVLQISPPGISAPGNAGRAPFQPLSLPGGGTATFGK